MGTNYFQEKYVFVVTIFVILAVLFSVSGKVNADSPNPMIAVSLTQYWFMADNFQPNTLVTFSVFEFEGAPTPVFEIKRYTNAHIQELECDRCNIFVMIYEKHPLPVSFYEL